jgi:hypothetical protein
MILIVLLGLKYVVKHLMRAIVIPLRNKVVEWNRAFELADVSSISSQQDSCIQKDLNAETSTPILIGHNMPFRNAWALFHDLRQYCLWFAWGSVIVLMPTYRVMNLYVSMFEEKYMWEFSSIYMTGYAAGASLPLAASLLLCSIYFEIEMHVVFNNGRME